MKKAYRVFLAMLLGVLFIGCPSGTQPTQNKLQVWWSNDRDTSRQLIADDGVVSVGQAATVVNVIALSEDGSAIKFQSGTQNVVWNNGSEAEVGLNPGTEPQFKDAPSWGFCNCNMCRQYNLYYSSYVYPGRMWYGPCPYYDGAYWRPVYDGNFAPDMLVVLVFILGQIQHLPFDGQMHDNGTNQLWFNIGFPLEVHSIGCLITTDKGSKAFSIERNTPMNHTPVSSPQSLAIGYGQQLSIVLTGSDMDGDALSYAVLTNPSHGTLSGTPPNLVYTPTNGFSGNDSFTFNVSDGELNSSPATVSINVGSAPSQPTTVFMTPSPTSGNAPLTVVLPANTSYATGVSIVNYKWDPDGQSSGGNPIFWMDSGSIPIISFTYISPGTYTAYVMVTDSTGYQAQNSVDITVN